MVVTIQSFDLRDCRPRSLKSGLVAKESHKIDSQLEGSGLEKLLVQVYSGKNVVSHMMSGKAISRVLRGLYLVDSILRMILLNILKGEK